MPVVHDYNGEGEWTARAVQERYALYAQRSGIPARDLSPSESVNERTGTRWVYPVMDRVIEGIEAGDRACARIGVEFIELDTGFTFGKILKSNTARALRRAARREELGEDLRRRIVRRVMSMLERGYLPHEYREYAKLAKAVGYGQKEIPDPAERSGVWGQKWRAYFEAGARGEE